VYLPGIDTVSPDGAAWRSGLEFGRLPGLGGWGPAECRFAQRGGDPV